MHHIHHTEGLILESRDFGESGKRYAIFTRDLGLIYARATGVRQMASKLRFVLTDFAYVKADLVQGRVWRITSASKTGRLERITKNPETLRVLGNMAALLRRLLVAAEPNEKMFRDLIQGLSVIENAPTKEDISTIEAIVVLRLLHDLGYIGESAALKTLIESPFGQELVYEASASRSFVLRAINKALRESHL